MQDPSARKLGMQWLSIEYAPANIDSAKQYRSVLDTLLPLHSTFICQNCSTILQIGGSHDSTTDHIPLECGVYGNGLTGLPQHHIHFANPNNKDSASSKTATSSSSVTLIGSCCRCDARPVEISLRVSRLPNQTLSILFNNDTEAGGVNTLIPLSLYAGGRLLGGNKDINALNPKVLKFVGDARRSPEVRLVMTMLGFIHLEHANTFAPMPITGAEMRQIADAFIQLSMLETTLRQSYSMTSRDSIPFGFSDGAEALCLKLGFSYRPNLYQLAADTQSTTQHFQALGCTSDASTERIKLAYRLQSNDNGALIPWILDAITELAQLKASPDLEEFAALEHSKNEALGLSDVRNAYRTLGLPIDISVTQVNDAMLISVFKAQLKETPQSASELRRALRIIAESRDSAVINVFLETGDAPRYSDFPGGDMPDPVPVGLNNIGNICYFNCLLQFYLTVTPLREMVLGFPDDFQSPRLPAKSSSPTRSPTQQSSKEMGPPDPKYAFVPLLKSLFTNIVYLEGPAGSVSPTKELAQLALGNPDLEIGSQQDISECMGNVVSLLELGFKHVHDSQTLDMIKAMFYGKTMQSLEYEDAKAGKLVRTKKEEDFLCIIVDVAPSLYQSLDAFFRPEKVDYESQAALRTIHVATLPAFLTIMINRVNFDKDKSSLVKSHQFMKFPNRILMDRYMADNIDEVNQRREQLAMAIEASAHDPENNDVDALSDAFFGDMQSHAYILHAALIHEGEADFGHYRVYLRDHERPGLAGGDSPRWLLYDDSVVREHQYPQLVGTGPAVNGGDGSTGSSSSSSSSSRRDKRSSKQSILGPYVLLRTIGEGEFGKVKLATHRESMKEVAIKLIKKESITSASRRSKLLREITILQSLNHPYIVKLFEVLETDSHIAMVMEYAAGGELFEYILAHTQLKERDACRFFAQLLAGVSYLHSVGIVHRDLKLENLLLDSKKNIIITDFGFANKFRDGDSDILMQTSCGSPCYAAPELVVNEGYAGEAADIWSCGVILYAMLCGYLPFDDDPENPDSENINLLYKYIMETVLEYPDHVSMDARDLMGRILVPDPTYRITMQEMIAHRWLTPAFHIFEEEMERINRELMNATPAVPSPELDPIEEDEISSAPPMDAVHPELAGISRAPTTDPVVPSNETPARMEVDHTSDADFIKEPAVQPEYPVFYEEPAHEKTPVPPLPKPAELEPSAAAGLAIFEPMEVDMSVETPPVDEVVLIPPRRSESLPDVSVAIVPSTNHPIPEKLPDQQQPVPHDNHQSQSTKPQIAPEENAVPAPPLTVEPTPLLAPTTSVSSAQTAINELMSPTTLLGIELQSIMSSAFSSTSPNIGLPKLHQQQSTTPGTSRPPSPSRKLEVLTLPLPTPTPPISRSQTPMQMQSVQPQPVAAAVVAMEASDGGAGGDVGVSLKDNSVNLSQASIATSSNADLGAADDQTVPGGLAGFMSMPRKKSQRSGIIPGESEEEMQSETTLRRASSTSKSGVSMMAWFKSKTKNTKSSENVAVVTVAKTSDKKTVKSPESVQGEYQAVLPKQGRAFSVDIRMSQSKEESNSPRLEAHRESDEMARRVLPPKHGPQSTSAPSIADSTGSSNNNNRDSVSSNHRGPIDRRALTSRSPKHVLRELEAFLTKNGFEVLYNGLGHGQFVLRLLHRAIPNRNISTRVAQISMDMALGVGSVPAPRIATPSSKRHMEPLSRTPSVSNQKRQERTLGAVPNSEARKGTTTTGVPTGLPGGGGIWKVMASLPISFTRKSRRTPQEALLLQKEALSRRSSVAAENASTLADNKDKEATTTTTSAHSDNNSFIVVGSPVSLSSSTDIPIPPAFQPKSSLSPSSSPSSYVSTTLPQIIQAPPPLPQQSTSSSSSSSSTSTSLVLSSSSASTISTPKSQTSQMTQHQASPSKHSSSSKSGTTKNPQPLVITSEMKLNVEMTSVKNLDGLYVVYFKRMKGDVWEFKRLYHRVLNEVLSRDDTI